MIKRFLCRLFGHNFVSGHDQHTKRKCHRCHREEWMFSREFPRVGEAKYYWKEMEFSK